MLYSRSITGMIERAPGEPSLSSPLTDSERDQRIEQLLVAGLDEYFAGRLDQAVNIWTRVLFLDRSNDRARAYIDRTRRMEAERQREAEALVHQGLQAFDEGDVERARRLLTTAVARGAAHEQALPVLHRIGLLDVAPGEAERAAYARTRAASDDVRQTAAARWPLGAVWGVGLLAAVAAAFVAIESTTPDPVTSTIGVSDAVLPVPAASEVYLSRARQLFDAGKLPDALRMLDRIDDADAVAPAARALRVRLQRELLATAGPPGREGVQP